MAEVNKEEVATNILFLGGQRSTRRKSQQRKRKFSKINILTELSVVIDLFDNFKSFYIFESKRNILKFKHHLILNCHNYERKCLEGGWVVREDSGAAGYAEQEGQTKMQEGGQITGQEQMVLGQGK